MPNIEYRVALDKELEQIAKLDKRPVLLLHACCAPCASYVLEYLTSYFDIIVYFCNPNISTEEEYMLRLSEVKRLAEEMPHENTIRVIDAGYDPSEFLVLTRGREDAPERSERCQLCISLRLIMASKLAEELGVDWFTSTLTVSPHKDSKFINDIGGKMGEDFGIPYLRSDFKKRGGYQRSIELSKAYGLYRQNFCGCMYSMNSERKDT